MPPVGKKNGLGAGIDQHSCGSCTVSSCFKDKLTADAASRFALDIEKVRQALQKTNDAFMAGRTAEAARYKEEYVKAGGELLKKVLASRNNAEAEAVFASFDMIIRNHVQSEVVLNFILE